MNFNWAESFFLDFFWIYFVCSTAERVQICLQMEILGFCLLNPEFSVLFRYLEMSKFWIFLIILIFIEQASSIAQLPFLNLRFKRQVSPDAAANSWPAGSYCIFGGNGNQCPPGFTIKSVRLSVAPDFEPNVSCF